VKPAASAFVAASARVNPIKEARNAASGVLVAIGTGAAGADGSPLTVVEVAAGDVAAADGLVDPADPPVPPEEHPTIASDARPKRDTRAKLERGCFSMSPA